MNKGTLKTPSAIMSVLLTIGLATATVSQAQTQQFFVVAVHDEHRVFSSNGQWVVDAGEVYYFQRFLSSFEYGKLLLKDRGISELDQMRIRQIYTRQDDTSFCVLRMDDVELVASTANFMRVEPKDMSAAIAKYNLQIVENNKAKEKIIAAQRQQELNARQQQITRNQQQMETDMWLQQQQLEEIQRRQQEIETQNFFNKNR